jgi:hypothetical protein
MQGNLLSPVQKERRMNNSSHELGKNMSVMKKLSSIEDNALVAQLMDNGEGGTIISRLQGEKKIGTPTMRSKKKKKILKRANTLLGNLNEIKEEDEEGIDKKLKSGSLPKSKKVNKIRASLKEETSSKERSSKQNTNSKAQKLEDDQISIESGNILEHSQKKSGDQKRRNFKKKGRGKSEILPPRQGLYLSPSMRPTSYLRDPRYFYQEEGNPRSSPRFFIQPTKTGELIPKFPSMASKSPLMFSQGRQRRIQSLHNLDQINSPYNLDYKQQELIRRRNQVMSMQSDDEEESEELLDEEYFNYVKELGLAQRQGEEESRSNQDFIHQRGEKDLNVKEWYKMVRNLRFKTHYNHFMTNLKFKRTWLLRFDAQEDVNEAELERDKEILEGLESDGDEESGSEEEGVEKDE